MGLIQDLIKNGRAKKEKEKEYETDARIRERYEEKKMSADDRELSGWIEQRRKERVRKMLDNIRKQRMNEFWHKDVISQKNLFNNHKRLFTARGTI